MSQQIINISTPDDGLGDALRNGFDKTNQNFTELYNGKVDKVTGKGLSENDFTDADKTKLDGIEAGAQVNVQSDFAETDPLAPGYILNVPPSLYSSVGFFDYNDLATQTTPLTLVANVPKKLTNDTLGSFTNIDNPPYGVATIWNETTNEFDFSSLSVGDTIDLRVDLLMTTVGANENVKMFLRLAKGSPSQYDLYFYEKTFKNSGSNPIQTYYGIYIGSEDFKDYPAELYIVGDNGGTVVVNGWYSRVIRKYVNILEVSGGSQNLQQVTDLGNSTTNYIELPMLRLNQGVLEVDLSADVLTESRELFAPDENGTIATREWSNTNKQDTLVSGTNIKTINGNSVLGGGDLVISNKKSIEYNVTSLCIYNFPATSNWTCQGGNNGMGAYGSARVDSTYSNFLTLIASSNFTKVIGGIAPYDMKLTSNGSFVTPEANLIGGNLLLSVGYIELNYSTGVITNATLVDAGTYTPVTSGRVDLREDFGGEITIPKGAIWCYSWAHTKTSAVTAYLQTILNFEEV